MKGSRNVGNFVFCAISSLYLDGIPQGDSFLKPSSNTSPLNEEWIFQKVFQQRNESVTAASKRRLVKFHYFNLRPESVCKLKITSCKKVGLFFFSAAAMGTVSIYSGAISIATWMKVRFNIFERGCKQASEWVSEAACRQLSCVCVILLTRCCKQTPST